MKSVVIRNPWFWGFAILLFAGSLGAAHIHFLHQSTGGNWLAPWSSDPDWGGGNLQADLEAAGHTVTDEWVSGDNAPYIEWDPENDGLCHFFLNNGALLSDDGRTADILVIKSCFYPTNYLENDGVLNNWKSHSISEIVQGYYNNHPEKKLIYCSTMPHHRLSGELPLPDRRARARDWGEWLVNQTTGLPSYATHNNVRGFDAFGLIARPESDPDPNTLKSQYEISSVDDHMNRQGNMDCAAAVRALVNEMVGIGEKEKNLPKIVFLKAEPNPGRVPLTISFYLPSMNRAALCIYDVSGHLVQVLAHVEGLTPKVYTVVWLGTNSQGARVPAGIYFCVLSTGSMQMTEKYVLTK